MAERTGEQNAPAQLTLLPEIRGRGREVFTIDVRAQDREGLLLDITSFLKESGVSLSSNQGSVDDATGIARIVLEVKLASFVELAIVIDGLRQIPGVLDATRLDHQGTRRQTEHPSLLP